MQIKRLLIIPARSGSKRIKNKNFKKFKGKPIISYSILTALKSKIFSKIDRYNNEASNRNDHSVSHFFCLRSANKNTIKLITKRCYGWN